MSNYFLKILAIILIFGTFGCVKDHTPSQNNYDQNTDVESYGISKLSLAAPTKKAIEYRVTDLETGEVTVMYDCTNPGRSCDVGEKEPPIKSLSIPIGQSAADYLYNNESTFSSYFPLLFEEAIKSDVQENILDLEYSNGYLVLSKNTLPIMVYPINDFRIAVTTDSIELRKAVINLETGVIECIDSGKNCSVPKERTDLTSEMTISEIIAHSFSGENLMEKILDGEYEIINVNNEYYHIKPNNPILQSYYILY